MGVGQNRYPKCNHNLRSPGGLILTHTHINQVVLFVASSDNGGLLWAT